MNEKYAVINIGFLKTKCLIVYLDDASGKSVPLHRSNELTCFSCGMHENGNRILEKYLQETIDEILKIKQIINKYQCIETKIFATNALRLATNNDYVKRRIENKTKLEVEIVTPEKKGELYFQAMMQCFPYNRDYIVVDMGEEMFRFRLAIDREF